jgi:TonB family protein
VRDRSEQENEGQMRAKSCVAQTRVFALCAVALSLIVASLYGQEARKVITRVTPAYPEMARRMGLQGTVKVRVVIGADGQVKDTRVVGGSPLLVESTLDAVKRWKYAPASSETTAVLEFNFHP